MGQWKNSKSGGHKKDPASQSRYLLHLYRENVGGTQFDRRISTLKQINDRNLMSSLLNAIRNQIKVLSMFGSQKQSYKNVSPNTSRIGVQKSIDNTNHKNIYTVDPTCHQKLHEITHLKHPSQTSVIEPRQGLTSIVGTNCGIQGHYNSSCIDSTIFSMFSFSSCFDVILNDTLLDDESPIRKNIRRILTEEIVNPLRKEKMVGAEKMLLFREALEGHTCDKSFILEEKDPEDLIELVFERIFKTPPYLEMSSGGTSHLYHLLVMSDLSKRQPPTIQELVDKSFFNDRTKFIKIPKVLMLKMPRFGAEKVFEHILPSPLLDITDFIESGITSKTTRRVSLELFAVLCIDTAHYVTFVKCGNGNTSSWCFHDSMADRTDEGDDCNIPEIRDATEVFDFVTSDRMASSLEKSGAKFLNSEMFLQDVESRTLAKRLLCHSYLSFYRILQ